VGKELRIERLKQSFFICRLVAFSQLGAAVVVVVAVTGTSDEVVLSLRLLAGLCGLWVAPVDDI